VSGFYIREALVSVAALTLFAAAVFTAVRACS
jgi:hypothetical protein